jgi:endonuclease/exonuclease/phosphatase family metal-dependent hydrolase
MSKINGLKLMTYNIGGGRKDLGSAAPGILKIIGKEKPDLLAIQEATAITTNDELIETVTEVAKEIGYNHTFFGPTLSMTQNFHVNKAPFVFGIFNNYLEWQQGNALFSHWPFANFKTPSAGSPRNIPIYSTLYDGNRDTEPRFVILAKINHTAIPFYILTTHLTTLLGERGGEIREILGVTEKAEMLRYMQCNQIINLIKEHLLLKNQLVFLLGDFNAVPTEPCIEELIGAGFVHLTPEAKGGTHVKQPDDPIDHIFVYPGQHFIKYSARIIKNDDANGDAESFGPSDHLPVLAEVDIYDQGTDEFKSAGSRVIRKDIIKSDLSEPVGYPEE